jgi:hypothetical protein
MVCATSATTSIIEVAKDIEGRVGVVGRWGVEGAWWIEVGMEMEEYARLQSR